MRKSKMGFHGLKQAVIKGLCEEYADADLELELLARLIGEARSVHAVVSILEEEMGMDETREGGGWSFVLECVADLGAVAF